MRISLTDGSGRYFYVEKAAEYKEATHEDGGRIVSKATGNPYDHQYLYHTAIEGRWVLNCWSEGASEETYEEISPSKAEEWLCRNGHSDALPLERRKLVEI